MSTHLANYLLIYKFTNTTEVIDISGNQNDGTLSILNALFHKLPNKNKKIKIGSSLSAQQTFTSTNMVTLPTTICSSLQPLTSVVGFYFSISLAYVSTRVSNFISILSVINHFT